MPEETTPRDAEEEAKEGTEAREGRRKIIRPLIAVLIFLSLFLLSWLGGFGEQVTSERIQAFVKDAGAWGVLAYLVIFVAGEFIQLPGMMFVAAAILAYGKLLGFGLALLGSLLSVCFTFIVIRTIGGKALAKTTQPFVKKMLATLDERPVRTVIILRLLLWLSPALNYALAMTRIGFRDYLVGSILGLVPPLAVAAIFFEWLFT